MPTENSARLTVLEVAEECRVTHWTVRGWLTQKKLRKLKAGGRVLIERTDLDAFIRESTEAGNIEAAA